MSCVPVEEGYARWAPTYDRDPNPLLALEERQLRPLVGALEGRRVLDLACGTGRWATWLLEQGARSVIGVDLSPAMLAAASQKVLLRGRLVIADGYSLPFPPQSFDLVICSFALAHVRDLARLAGEVVRVTTPGTDLYVTDLHPAAHAQGWKTAFRDRLGPVEIATWPRSLHVQLAAWGLAGFRCVEGISAALDEYELPILARAGKSDRFDQIRRVPAIQIMHFKAVPSFPAAEEVLEPALKSASY